MGEVAGAAARAISQVAKAATEAPLGAIRSAETATSLARESVDTAAGGQVAAGEGLSATGEVPAEAISADEGRVGPQATLEDLAEGRIEVAGQEPMVPPVGQDGVLRWERTTEPFVRNQGVGGEPATAAAETPTVVNEQTQVYENPAEDPAYAAMRNDAADAFVEKYPEKAGAYAEKDPDIKAALERKAKGEEGQEPAPTEPAAEAGDRVAQLEQKMADLSSQNELLSNEVASMKGELAQTKEQLLTLQKGMTELAQPLQSFLKGMEQKTQDPKEKETLAGLIAKLTLLLAVTAFAGGQELTKST